MKVLQDVCRMKLILTVHNDTFSYRPQFTMWDKYTALAVLGQLSYKTYLIRRQILVCIYLHPVQP